MPSPDDTVGPTIQLNALPLEYERDYGTAKRDMNVADLINNPAASGKCSVFGLRLEEELINVLFPNSGPFRNYGTNPVLVTHNTI